MASTHSHSMPVSQKGKFPPKGFFPQSPNITARDSSLPSTDANRLVRASADLSIPNEFRVDAVCSQLKDNVGRGVSHERLDNALPPSSKGASQANQNLSTLIPVPKMAHNVDIAWSSILPHILSTNISSSSSNIAPASAKSPGQARHDGRSNLMVKIEPTDTDGLLSTVRHTEDSLPTNRIGRSRGATGQGGRPRTVKGSRIRRTPARASGVKRARGQDYSDGEDGNHGASSGDELIALPATSRSGRRITQASSFSPTVIDLDDVGDVYPKASPVASKGQHLNTSPTANRADGSRHGGRRTSAKLPKRKPGEAAVCRNCGRGYSPPSNMIVFCDGCNIPWHQSCHDPPITSDILREESSQWFCGDCVCRASEESTWERRVSMGRLSLVEQRHYLSTLAPHDLVSLVLQAATLHPDLPIFTPPVDEEEGWNYLQERELLPYPRPGNGIRLSPERKDEGMLIDDNIVAFSHRYGWTERDLFGQPRGMEGGDHAGGGQSTHAQNVMMGGVGLGIGA